MRAIGWLDWGARWCRLGNGGCILRNGWKLLFAKGQPGRAGSLIPVPTLFLVRSLLFSMRNITNLNVKKQVDWKPWEPDGRRLLFEPLCKAKSRPLRLHCLSGLQLYQEAEPRQEQVLSAISYHPNLLMLFRRVVTVQCDCARQAHSSRNDD